MVSTPISHTDTWANTLDSPVCVDCFSISSYFSMMILEIVEIPRKVDVLSVKISKAKFGCETLQ